MNLEREKIIGKFKLLYARIEEDNRSRIFSESDMLRSLLSAHDFGDTREVKAILKMLKEDGDQ